jgi:outer membrane protein assembly factor BamB
MVLALDRSSGTQTWKNEQLLMRQTSAPHVLDGRLMVGDYEGYLHVLSPEDGSVVARLKTDGSAIVAAPIEFSDGLLVQTQGGGLYSVTLR